MNEGAGQGASAKQAEGRKASGSGRASAGRETIRDKNTQPINSYQYQTGPDGATK